MDLKTHVGWFNHVSSASELSLTHEGGAGSSSVISTLPLANLLTEQLAEVCRIHWVSPGIAVLRFERADLPMLGMFGLMGVVNSNNSYFNWRATVYDGATILADSALQETLTARENLVFTWDVGTVPDAVEIQLFDLNYEAYFDLGYLFVGDRWTPEEQASDGWQEQPIDYSQVDETPSGQFYAARRSTGRIVRLKWDALSGLDMYGIRVPNVAEYRYSYVDRMMAHCGIARPVIAVAFEESITNRPWVRPIYGRFVELQPWTKLAADMFAWSCSIKEHY